MVFFVLILLLMMFSSAKAVPPDTFCEDYLSRRTCDVVKGIFVLLIFLSHGKSYIQLGGVYDDPYLALQGHLNQLVVVMFFFYSGYGMMEQIKKKGREYVRSVAAKRFPALLLKYDIAVILFLITNWILGNHISFQRFLAALTGWSSIGNSNWYIFDILALYVFTVLAFLPSRKSGSTPALFFCTGLLTAMSAALIIFFKRQQLDHWWYDTMLFFSAGFWYSLLKERIEKLLMKNDIVFSLAAALVLAVYLLAFRRRWRGLEYYTVWAACFVALIVMFTMKISLNSLTLSWFGQHVFSIYILQRIPFMVLIRYGYFTEHKYAFLIASLAATIPMALIFEAVTGKLETMIWKPKQRGSTN